jgi:hypothetical protein
LPALGEFGFAITVGEKAVMTDVLQSLREDVQEEAANELLGGKRHGFFRGAVLVVLPKKANAARGN